MGGGSSEPPIADSVPITFTVASYLGQHRSESKDLTHAVQVSHCTCITSDLPQNHHISEHPNHVHDVRRLLGEGRAVDPDLGPLYAQSQLRYEKRQRSVNGPVGGARYPLHARGDEHIASAPSQYREYEQH